MDSLTIDLNCDMGEGCGNDAELIRFISSANIACGYHAGDEDTMKRTVDLALENGVAIGAHPGYRDRENFGRTPMDLTPEEIGSLITEQIGVLDKITKAAGGSITHVKPHGALYNKAARDRDLAGAIARAVSDYDRGLALFGLSGSESINEAKKCGLRTVSEVFADRTYQTDGSLTSRNAPNALIQDENTALTQVLDMIKYGRVRSTDGIMIAITAETVCIHGDGQNAVKFARTINQALTETGILIKPVNG